MSLKLGVNNISSGMQNRIFGETPSFTGLPTKPNYSFGLINPMTGVNFNTTSQTLSKLNLNKGLPELPDMQSNIQATTNKISKVIAKKDASAQDTSSTTEQAPGAKRMFVSSKKAQRLVDRGKATKIDNENNTDGSQLIERKKKRFMDTRFGKVLGNTTLGRATRAVVDTVEEGKARRAAAANNNK